MRWEARPFFDGEWVTVFSVPGLKYRWKEVQPGLWEHEYVTEIRQFETGASRDTDNGKLDYEGFLSPLVLKRFAEYMHKNRVQKDGSLRDSDNWQKGIPFDAYMKSGWRHFMDWWLTHRGFNWQAELVGIEIDVLEEALCAILFNVQGYLHELEKAKVKGPSLAEQKRRDRATAVEAEAAFRGIDLHHCDGCNDRAAGVACPHERFSQGCVYEVKGGA